VPLVSLDNVSTAFGHVPLLQDASLLVEPGERIAVIGRNGTGKSTLLRILNGDLIPDAGSVWRGPGVETALLVQDAALETTDTVFNVVAEGLGDLRDIVKTYHRAVVDVAEHATAESLARLGRLQHALEERDGWRVEQCVEEVISRLDLPADAVVSTLSGGWRRRVLLARALVAEPAVLLLDEPTNHLDVDAIEWLEAFLSTYAGAVVFVTHDRAFLQRLATRVVDLDRGRLTSWPGDYATFLEKKDAWLESEALANAKVDTRQKQEEAWLRRGVKARRTRDEGRVRALMAMREARRARREVAGDVRLTVDVAERSGHVVFEAESVTKAYGDSVVVAGLSTRVIRGDRIGLVGPNGAGKTTLLRLLIGSLQPDAGEIRRGTNVEVAYFDQQREQLDPERSVVDTVADGNDRVTVGGVTRHVHGYLEDFLFPRDRARSPVKALSGGERNRLLLARLLTRPANVLVLDEPTNDLDLETLELLEAELIAFPGTLLIVSHDRTFLNNVVTSVWAFEGNGRVEEYVGGYDDWLRQRPEPLPAQAAKVEVPASTSAPRPARGPDRKKLSFKEKRELEALPARIETLEQSIASMKATIAGPEFYRETAATITETMATLEFREAELIAAYERWSELESRTS
jgi:ATP-binding cassette subfamily F protein uup